MAKIVQLWKIFGNTNHKIGNVIEDATIHVKIIFQFLISSCLKKSLQIKNNIIVSNMIVVIRDIINLKIYVSFTDFTDDIESHEISRFSITISHVSSDSL